MTPDQTHFEVTLRELDDLNRSLMARKRGGGSIAPEEYTHIKELVRKIHEESKNLEVPEIGRLLNLHEMGLGIRYLEPNYTKLNEAFAWLEDQSGEGDDEDF